jgi:glycosyltransferase involved in cell wall biosynthesis
VSFAGYVPSWFRHAKGHAFVNYSANEGLCITNLEAMSAGLPLVTTPVGAIPDYATDGETAFIVNSPAELLSALLRIHTDPYAAGQIANRAAARVRQVYSLENLQALGSRLFPISRP